MPPTSLRLRSFSNTLSRFSLLSIGARSKCGGTTGSLANDHLPFLTSCSGGSVSSSRCPTAEDSTYFPLSKYSPLRVNPPSARDMSAATDGFSAMMSFFDMRGREGYPQRECRINSEEKTHAFARGLQLGKRVPTGDKRSSATSRLLGVR